MLSKERKKLEEERHEQLVRAVKHKYPNDQHAHHSEAMWEHTLSELSSGEYDSVLGLRLFLSEILARTERDEFIDKTAIRLCAIARSNTTESELKSYARVAYQQAEVLWRERQERRNRNANDEIPF